MKNYKITTLKMGDLVAEKSSLTMGKDFGKYITIPIWSVVIEGNGHKIVVDTGIRSLKWVKQYLGDQYDVFQEKDETMEGALKAIGWKTEDVDIVINTHLHYDHAGCNHLFTNAKFYVQRAEWDYAFDCVENQKCFYFEELYGWKAVRYTQWKFVDGESEILPGIRLIPLGGHTVGSQGILVKTDEGEVFLAGDAANLGENLWENNLPNIMVDVDSGYRALEIIRSRANSFIPFHDSLIHKYQHDHFLPVYR